MGLFGSKLRIPMQAMLSPDMEDTAQGPSMATAAPTARPKGLFGSKYGGPQLNRMQVLGAMFQQLGDNRGQLNDLYQMEDQRQRAAFEQQREEAMLTALQDAAPDAVKPYVQFAPKEVLGGLIKQAFPVPETTETKIALARLGLDQDKFDFERQTKDRLTPYQQAQLEIDRARFNLEQTKGGNVSLAEARQWGNSYNDDVDAYNKDLGILRPALPYAQQVVRSKGNPGGNFRMNDVALLRAAARAQTGPGVLMESEVYGTLSSSLKQALQNRVSYVDISKGSITPEDRAALAEYVLQGGSQTSGDIWRRYESTTTPLRQRGVEPESVGVLGPEMIHPDDMPSFLGQPLENFQVGQGYTGPSGRRYIYQGQGRFRFANQNQYNPGLAMDRQKPGAVPPGDYEYVPGRGMVPRQ